MTNDMVSADFDVSAAMPLKTEETCGELDLAGDRSRRESGELCHPFQNLAAFAPTPLEWVWDGLIPRGKLVLIVGETGIGKSLVALEVAAMVTRGRRTPLNCSKVNAPKKEADGQAGNAVVDEKSAEPGLSSSAGPGHVVLLASADNGITDTIRPRLEAAGADIDRVFVFRCDRLKGDASPSPSERDAEATKRHQDQDEDAGAVRLKSELGELEANLLALQNEGVHVQLVVMDSVDRYLNSARKKQDLSGIVSRLVELATRSSAAVLVVATSASSRIGGAGYQSGKIGLEEFVNAARAAFMIVPDLEHQHQRLMLPVKSNFSDNWAGMAFTIRNGVVEWRSKRIPLTVNEYFMQAMERLRNPLHREESSELSRAVEWLQETLSERPISSIWIQCDANQNGIAYSTLRRAYCRLGCQSFRKPGTTRWFWRLPGPASVSIHNSLEEPDQVAQNVEIEQLEKHGFDHEK